jgi:hypothetical protein
MPRKIMEKGKRKVFVFEPTSLIPIPFLVFYPVCKEREDVEKDMK